MGYSAWIRAFYFFVLLAGGVGGWAQAADASAVKPETLKAIDKHLVALKDHDPHVRSQAAEDLAAYPFVEVKDALLDAAWSELAETGAPNTFVLKACVASLSLMVGPKDGEKLTAILNAVRSQPKTNRWMREIEVGVGELLRKSVSPSRPNLPRLLESAPEKGETFLEALARLVRSGKLDPEVAKALRAGTERDISADMAAMASDPNNPTIVGRKDEADQAFKVWCRMKSRIPVLVGTAGVGKTAVAQQMALMIRRGDFPNWFMYRDEFPKGMVMLQTSAARIGRLALSNTDAAQAAALELYLDSIKEAQKALGVPVVLFMDEWHTLTRGQCNALKPYAEELNGVRILGATTTREFELLVSNDDAMRRRLEPIAVRELSEEETVTVLKQGWIQQMEKRYQVRIPDTVLPLLVKLAADVVPDRARPDGPIKFVQDLAIHVSRHAAEKGEKNPTITDEVARKYATDITGLPINPRDPQSLLRYIEQGRERIKERVIGQDHVVDVLVDTWMDVLTSDAARAWRSVAVIGTTGTGKSLSAQQLGEVFLKSREKVKIIDCTAYQSGGHGLNSLLGAPNGIISSDETKGVLPEYLSGPGKQSGVIIFNEFDKAHPDLAKRLMEMIDRGELTGGDGHVYRLRRHLVVFTTNRGASRIFNEKLGHLLSSEELSRRVRRITESEARSFFTQSEGYAYLDEYRLPPEVVNRIDRWVVAKPIIFEDALKIAALKARAVQKENADLHKLEIDVDKALIEAITRVAFVPADGARPVEKRVETLLSRARALAWSKLEVVQGAGIRVGFEKKADGHSRVLVYEMKSEKLLGELPFDEPTRFMALKDPRFLEVLMNLEANMKKEIFGQDQVLEQAAAAVRARANRPLDPAPLSLWLIGSTGTGKTETAKVLAKYLYGSADRAQVISFGRVNHKFELNDIFSPPRGVVGSETKAIFETILESFPEGTVIVFDEISNMGQGASPQEKDSLFKSLYEIFGEGKWTNPHGKTYHLANYTFVLTGNDGEKLFEALPSPDLRESVWKENHTREAVKKILRQSHIPEAFINRMDGLILMKPLSGQVRDQIGDKFLARLVRQLEEAHGVKIEFAPGFTTRMTRAFFPVGDGARGTERFVKTDLAAFLGDYIIANYPAISAQKPGQVCLRVDIALNFPDKTWAVKEKSEPKAILKLESNLAKNNKAEKIVEPTSAPRLTLQAEAEAVADHEAGHALVNEHLGQPAGPLKYLTIESAGDYGGYARYDSEKASHYPTLEYYLRRIAVLAAGQAGQRANGATRRDAGWKSDRDKMNQIAFAAVVEFGLVEGFEFMPPGEKGQIDFNRLDAATRTQVIRMARIVVGAGMALADTVLADPKVKEQMQITRALLLEKGAMGGAEFLKAIGTYRWPNATLEKQLAELIRKIDAASVAAQEQMGCAEILLGQKS